MMMATVTNDDVDKWGWILMVMVMVMVMVLMVIVRCKDVKCMNKNR